MSTAHVVIYNHGAFNKNHQPHLLGVTQGHWKRNR